MRISGRRPRSLAWCLWAFGLTLALPLLVFSAVTIYELGTSRRAQLKRTADDANNAILVALEREVSSQISGLVTLAQSANLWSASDQAQDLSPFYMESLLYSRVHGLNVVLRDMSGKQLVNTRLPWGAMLPTQHLPGGADGHVIETKKPYVSELVFGAVTQEPFLVITAPVLRGDEVTYLLSVNLPVGRLEKLMHEQGVRAPYVGSITDRNGMVLARTDRPQDFFNTQLAGFTELSGDYGTWEGSNRSGVPVFGLYRRSDLTGSLVTVGIAKEIMEAPFRRSLLLLAGLGLVLLLSALLLAYGVSRRLTQDVRSVLDMAEALASGRRVEAQPVFVREAEVLASALTSTARDLGERDRRLERANRELEDRVNERTRELAMSSAVLQATLDNMDQGLVTVDSDGVVSVCNRRALELLDLPADLMATRPTFETVRRYQLERNEFAKSDDQLRRWVSESGVHSDHHAYERERPNGTVLEIRSVPLPEGGIVRTYTDITARKRAERQIEHIAGHDPLTQLPNRTLFQRRLDQALSSLNRHDGVLALLCLDLDRFKTVNDTLGHPAGDALLHEVAKRILEVVRTEDTVARLGGDEFAIIQSCDGFSPQSARLPHAAKALAERIIAAVSRPVELEGRLVTVGVSIGIALAPANGSEAGRLFKNADLALYRAKSEGRNTARFYEATMDAQTEERRRMELDLRGALANGEFEVHFQPSFGVESRAVTGCEALVRWRHPTRGLVPPGDFIAIAEETGHIAAIGEWVLGEACRQAATWPKHLTVAVNVSAVQFRRQALELQIVAALAASGLAPNRLELEITETVLMEDSESVMNSLHALRALGVRIALDDFGTGYSSLSYLRRFPFDKIKIDRSFMGDIDDPSATAIVRAVVGLGRSLGATITAEGIETEDQFRLVANEGCSEVQGFLFSRPKPAAELRRELGGSRRQAGGRAG